VGTPPLISFVIPVYNDAARLRACLASIVRATGGTAEIIVVDNGSTDGSDSVAKEADATVLPAPRARLGELRNLGAARASGQVLAFVDADNEIAPGWVRAALETLGSDASIAAAGAPYSPPPGGTWVQRAYDTLRSHPRGAADTEWLGSGNLAIRRETFGALGGFDTMLETCEDVDLCRRVRGLGLRLIADERMRSIHHGDPATLGAVFVGELWRGRDNLRVSIRRPVTARVLASLLIPAVQLTALAALVVGIVLTILGWAAPGWTLASAGAAIVAIIVLSRTARMLANRRACGRLVDGLGTVAVAGTYELARALALAGGASHRRRRFEGTA
jgi:hypothetical protein